MAGDGQTKVKQARSLLASDLVTHVIRSSRCSHIVEVVGTRVALIEASKKTIVSSIR